MPTLRCSGKSHWFLPLIFLLMPFLTGVSTAETLDQIVNPKTTGNGWVSDMAEVLDDKTEQRLNELIDRLERETTAEIAVVTIRRTDGRTPKEFATDLFNRWGIGKTGEDNGVLVLMVVEERRIEVETGYGVEGVLPDGKVAAILDTKVIPRFKQGDIGGGLLAGVQAMADEIPAGTTSPPSVGWRILAPFGIDLKLAALILLLAVLSYYFVWRRQFRFCPQCRKRMRRLTEDQDDAYLSSAEKLEEQLGSVDYRVWRCDDCAILDRLALTRYYFRRALGWRTSYYEKCPECRHRTVSVRSHTFLEPSYTHNGMWRIVRKCRLPTCTFGSIEERWIPMLVQSSDDSDFGWSGGGGGFGGSGFGGGSSGGGGAGRGW